MKYIKPRKGAVFMSKTVNWGIMATGKIARTFAKAVNFAEGAKLYACASRSAEKPPSSGSFTVRKSPTLHTRSLPLTPMLISYTLLHP